MAIISDYKRFIPFVITINICPCIFSNIGTHKHSLRLLDKDMEAAAYNGNNALTIALAISMGIIFVAVAGKFRTEFKKRLK